MSESLGWQQWLQRKTIHFLTAAIPLYYHFSHNEKLVQWVAIVLAVGFLFVDVLRLKFSLVRKKFLNIFGKLLKTEENSQRLTGATMLFVGMALTVLLFPQRQAVPALLFVTLADPLAALVGQRFGTPFILDKSLEGSAAFYLTAATVILVFTNFSWWGLVVAIVVTIVELLPIGVDDNLLIPLVTAYLLGINPLN